MKIKAWVVRLLAVVVVRAVVVADALVAPLPRMTPRPRRRLRPRAWRGRRWTCDTPVAVPGGRRSTGAASRTRSSERIAADVPGTQRRVQADLLRRLAEPARLPVRTEHARCGLAADEGDVRP